MNGDNNIGHGIEIDNKLLFEAVNNIIGCVRCVGPWHSGKKPHEKFSMTRTNTSKKQSAGMLGLDAGCRQSALLDLSLPLTCSLRPLTLDEIF